MAQGKRRYRQRRQWGSIIPKKGSYFVAYTGPDGRRHTAGRSFVTRTDAEGWLSQERRLISADIWTPPKSRRDQMRRASMTVGELIEAHERHLEESGKVRASTLQTYRNTTANRITDPGGKSAKLQAIPLAYLTSDDAADWWRAVNKEFPDTPARNRAAFVRLRAAAAWGVRDKAIPLDANPIDVEGAEGKPAAKTQKQLPTTADLRAICAHLPDRYRLIGILCLFHGLRLGEALGLRVGDVKLGGKTPTIQVQGNLQRVAGEDGKMRMLWQEPKTDAGRREVPIIPEFIPTISHHLDEFASNRKKDWLTTTTAGTTLFDTSFRTAFDRARERAGVTAKVTPHYGRAYLTTALAERGATATEIGAILGQEDANTIFNTYMKVRESRKHSLMAGAGFEGE